MFRHWFRLSFGVCRKRKAVVLALRGTMSMADIVTDAVAHPENIDDWLPPHFAKVVLASAAGLLQCHRKPQVEATSTIQCMCEEAKDGQQVSYRHACCAQETNLDQGRAWGHAGIVAAASAVLADLEKGGILKVYLSLCTSVRAPFPKCAAEFSAALSHSTT